MTDRMALHFDIPTPPRSQSPSILHRDFGRGNIIQRNLTLTTPQNSLNSHRHPSAIDRKGIKDPRLSGSRFDRKEAQKLEAGDQRGQTPRATRNISNPAHQIPAPSQTTTLNAPRSYPTDPEIDPNPAPNTRLANP